MNHPCDSNRGLRELVERGKKCVKTSKTQQSSEEMRTRIRDRKWRSLVGELLYDIPPCLHRYLNLEMPEKWRTFNTNFLGRMAFHEFTLEVPQFIPIKIIYKQLLASTDWAFHRYEINDLHNSIGTDRLLDLPLFLAIACEYNHKPEKSKVVFEEIQGGLDENAKLIKMTDVKISSKDKKEPYVLTEMDFLKSDYFGFEPMGG